jgi:predicted metal-dependent enzyme (double-stranded beta helix superfamily)
MVGQRVTDLPSFITVARTIIAETPDHKEIPVRLKPHLEELLRHSQWLGEDYRRPDPEAFAVYTLHEEPGLLIMSAVFLPGQGTPVHDHCVWGMYGVLENETEDTRYERVDDGSRPGYAELRVVETRRVKAGEAMISYPPDNDIHRVHNVTGKTTIEIHVYGADLAKLERHVYDPERKTVRVIHARVPSSQ